MTNLPQRLLDEMTWSPGQEEDFFAPGPLRGWPLRIWPIFKRPFIRLNGRCYCFDLYGLFDNIYRVVQRTVTRLKGKRFIEYLNSAETVPIFDRDHRQTGTLKKADYRHVTICAVTIDPFTEMAAQVQHLKKIGVDVGSDPVWAVSVDDLRAYADVFDNPLVFLHYVEQRMQAFRSDIVRSDDEFDHLGLYLKHNHYATHAKELKGDSGAHITFAGYRSDIDAFFSAWMDEEAHPPPLRQRIPPRLFAVVDVLSRGARTGRAEVASYLLDLDGETRETIAKGIDEELQRQSSTRRPKPLSTHGQVRLTVFCWTDSCSVRDPALALKHARTVLLLHDEPRRLLLELAYSKGGELKDVAWRWIDTASIPEAEITELRADAERLRETRVASAKDKRRKIGRNEQCPCGSGKKYKRCCLER